MKIAQATFSPHCPLAFIQLSQPHSMLDDCWAEGNERVLVLGLRSDVAELRQGISGIADGNEVIEQACHGTRLKARLKVIIADDLEKIRGLLGGLAVDGIISRSERDKALTDLGVRSMPIHPLMSMDMQVGAGI